MLPFHVGDTIETIADQESRLAIIFGCCNWNFLHFFELATFRNLDEKSEIKTQTGTVASMNDERYTDLVFLFRGYVD